MPVLMLRLYHFHENSFAWSQFWFFLGLSVLTQELYIVWASYRQLSTAWSFEPKHTSITHAAHFDNTCSMPRLQSCSIATWVIAGLCKAHKVKLSSVCPKLEVACRRPSSQHVEVVLQTGVDNHPNTLSESFFRSAGLEASEFALRCCTHSGHTWTTLLTQWLPYDGWFECLDPGMKRYLAICWHDTFEWQRS